MLHGSALAIAAAIAFGASAASAQTASADQGPASTNDATQADIVVTGARLRTESLQDTPVAVSVISGAAVQALHASDLTAISGKVPNLVVVSNSSTPGLAGFGIRGVQSGDSDPASEPSIAVYVDGVYNVIQTGGLADLWDVDRIEILRGPQGTFLGKNSGGGAIVINHTRPTKDNSGYASIDYGSYNLVQAQAALNFRLSDSLSARVFGGHRQRDGYVTSLTAPFNTYGGELADAGRVGLLFNPRSGVNIYLMSDYSLDRGRPLANRNVSFAPDLQCTLIAPATCGLDTPYNSTRTNHTNQRHHISTWNNVLNAQIDLGGVDFTSITGYKQFRDRDVYDDLAGTSSKVIRLNGYQTNNNQFSQELRLSSHAGGFMTLNDKLDWLIGGWYGASKAYFNAPQDNFNGQTTQAEKVWRHGYALFGHADYHVTDAWQISAGIRYSHDHTRHDYNFRHSAALPNDLTLTQARSWSNTSFEAGTQYKIDAHKMVYYRFSQGYRGGGFNGRPPNASLALGFQPETSESHEIGLRTDWLDRAVQFNVTAFHTKFNNLQVSRVVSNNGATGQITDNAASSRSQGVEVELSLHPTQNFQLDFSYGYLDARYLSYKSQDTVGNPLDLSALPIRYSPKNTASVSTQYTLALEPNLLSFNEAVFHASFDWKDKYQTDALNAPNGLVKAYGLANMSVEFNADKRYSLNVYVQNVFDKHYLMNGNALSPVLHFLQDGMPRTAGVQLRVNF